MDPGWAECGCHATTDGTSAGCLSLLHVEDGYAWWLALDAVRGKRDKAAISLIYDFVLVFVSMGNCRGLHGTVKFAGVAASRWKDADIRWHGCCWVASRAVLDFQGDDGHPSVNSDSLGWEIMKLSPVGYRVT